MSALLGLASHELLGLDELLGAGRHLSASLFPHHKQVLGIWMMSPCKVLVLGPGSLPRGWSPAPVQWGTEGSSVRCASQATEERLQALDLTARVCSVPVMGTVRPVILSQVRRTEATAGPAGPFAVSSGIHCLLVLYLMVYLFSHNRCL